MRPLIFLAACAALSCAASIQTTLSPSAPAALAPAETNEPALHWQALTRGDVEAAYRLLKDNHPGAAREADDAAFVERLERRYQVARARAEGSRSMNGLAATLAEFANSMGDGHIWSYPKYRAPNFRWAGIILAKRGPRWVVENVSQESGLNSLIGQTLVSCDGVAVKELVSQRMPFYAALDAEYSLIKNAAWLLFDDDNPFLPKLKECTFADADAQKNTSVSLKWRNTNSETLEKNHWKRPIGAPGFGVRQVGNGFWVSVQSLAGNQTFNGVTLQDTVDEVKARRDELRTAPFIVIDLRGNGGGNSSYMNAITEEIFGRPAVEEAQNDEEAQNNGETSLRATEENIAGFQKAIDTQFRPHGDTRALHLYQKGIGDMRAAMAEGKQLTRPLGCSRANGAETKPKVEKNRLFVLTDVACFSSCLIAVEHLQSLGALQIGAPTGFNTRYSEVREVTLPSGVATFSTLQGIMPCAPMQFGPFSPEPKDIFEGDISDTAAVERWFFQEVLKQ